MPFDIIDIISPAPGKASAVESILHGMAQHVKDNEPGVLRYHVQKQTSGPHAVAIEGEVQFVILETFQDEKALEEHFTSSVFKDIQRRIKEEGLLARPLNIMRMEHLAGFAKR